MNEALLRADAMTQLVLLSRTTTTPPLSGADGDCFGVPAGATNAWMGRDGAIAVWSNGGWDFVIPAAGWRAWIADEGFETVHDGTGWVEGLRSTSPSGSSFLHRVVEFDHTLSAGASSTTSAVIPANAVVYGVAGRVLSDIAGTLSSWELGVSGSTDRYGSGLGLVSSSYVLGLTSNPLTYYTDTELLLTATAGDFASGSVRLTVHFAQITLPNG